MFAVDIVTLFPEVFAPFVGLSIVGRAIERQLIDVRYHHILEALEPGERADERPYGGGPGMVMRIEPLARILDGIIAAAPAARTPCNRRSFAGRKAIRTSGRGAP